MTQVLLGDKAYVDMQIMTRLFRLYGLRRSQCCLGLHIWSQACAGVQGLVKYTKEIMKSF